MATKGSQNRQEAEEVTHQIASGIPHQLPPSADGFVHPRFWEPFVAIQQFPFDRKQFINENGHWIWIAGPNKQVDISNWKLYWTGSDGKEKCLTLDESKKDPTLKDL